MTTRKNAHADSRHNSAHPLKVLAALGVVFGDIGTSPLYAVRESFLGGWGLAITVENVLGVISLIFWSLTLIISVKYLSFVLRADNRGEGGILALMALVFRVKSPDGRRRTVLGALGIFGAALLYGDSMITPAISVLSAVEGLRVATDFFDPFVIPISLGILIGLFLIQQRGTARVGAVFGPVVVVWFVILALMGIRFIVREPHVLLALDPTHAVTFFLNNGWHSFAVFGAIFLVVTGGEALYADIGHFGKKPILVGWFCLAFPALLLNYLGQGALLMHAPEALPDLFFHMAPRWALYPLVLFAAAATVIASQAVITGAFSLSRQAVQLGYCPRLTIRHTSDDEIGQIYVPFVNWALMLGTIVLVLGFRHSGALAHAYGVAVSTTMLITTILMYFVARRLWGWRLSSALAATCGFLLLDISFFGANVVKIKSGGWFPLLVAGLIYALMITWREGRRHLFKKLESQTLSIEEFLENIRQADPPRVPGIAVYLTGNPAGVPLTLSQNFNSNKIIHEHVFLLTVRTEEIPHVPENERVRLESLGEGLHRITVRHGFSQNLNVPAELHRIDNGDFNFRETAPTYFLGKESLVVGLDPSSGMWLWQKKLFVLISRNAQDATKFFGIPPDQTVEFGVQIKI